MPVVAEQQLESILPADDAGTEDDTYLQELEEFRKHPVNLNTANRDELAELHLLNDLQIENLLIYRRLLGPLINIYESQAIPGWNIPLIRNLLPFITIVTNDMTTELRPQFSQGQHTLLFRIGQLKKSNDNIKYRGGPHKLLFRYRYQYRNQLQYGVTGDKDAGEQFFKGAQSKGFDFYSFHVFFRRKGIIRTIALGDFTVNMGQGLIVWQSLAFGKSANTMNIKRQSPVLRPYTSSGEFNFHRGIGITFQKSRVELTTFISLRKLSANLDTINDKRYFSFFYTSGYHRTTSEVNDRNNLKQMTTGASLRYKHTRLSAGINALVYKYSADLQRQEGLYDIYAPTGDQWFNLSIDYDYIYRNLHFFGEAAIDKNLNKAVLNGMLLSVDPKVDLSVLYRTISRKYQSIQGSAFTESSLPSNENGLYAGIEIRPSSIYKISAYADIFNYPWLTYFISRPSAGKNFFIQFTYMPAKQTEIYTRFSNESGTGMSRKQNWRIHISHMLNPSVTLRNRVEMIWFQKESERKLVGFLSYVDILYKPMLKPLSAVLRLLYFETDGYDARLYAYENDVLYSYSNQAFYNKGYRYGLTINYDINKEISCWLRWSQTSGSNQNNEWKLQGRYTF
jgi:hypothetical protein